MRFYFYAFVLFLILLSCGPRPTETNVYRKNSFYPQDFKTTVAALVIEKNNRPFLQTSAFLLDKTTGLFVTAGHFLENLRGNDWKIFFNGKVYLGKVMATTSASDLAIIGIKGDFSPIGFPDSSDLSSDSLKLGQPVVIQGVRSHPLNFPLANKNLLGVVREYYGLSGEKRELVFDEIAAVVTNLAKEIPNKAIDGASKNLITVSSVYLEITAVQDHSFSFGGLSGGPVLDEQGKVVGIVTAGNYGGYFFDFSGFKFEYRPWKVIFATPVEELHEMMTMLLLDGK